MVADEAVVVLLTEKVTSRQIWENDIVALDAPVGAVRWRQPGGTHGQHFTGPLVGAPRRVLYVATRPPTCVSSTATGTSCGAAR